MELVSRPIFEKYANIKFHGKPSSGSRIVLCGLMDGRTSGRTDRHHNDAYSRFSQFCERAQKLFAVASRSSKWPSLSHYPVTVSFGFQQHDRKANRCLESVKTLAILHVLMSRSAYARGKVCISSVVIFTVV